MNKNDCQYISKVLGIKHQCHLKNRKKTKNTEVELNIDEDCEMLKKIYCLGIGKKMYEVMDVNCTCIKISKVIIQGAEMLNVCGHMPRVISIKCNRMINDSRHVSATQVKAICDNTTNEEEMHVDPNIVLVKIKGKKERRLKPCISLSTQHKKSDWVEPSA